jgi:GNAT superfamily N-acetyltransferase
MAVEVRPLRQSDHAEWLRLWTAYLEFYKTKVAEEVYASTWRRLFDDGEFEPNGMIAVVGGRTVGLVHYILHRTCWSMKNNCYLQDLYADPDMRGTGVGRALIEAVYAEADKLGITNVYWMTHETNEVGRRLYDRLARRTGFIEYER